jgi:hypothetical protein
LPTRRAGLELRLDQCHQLRLLGRERKDASNTVASPMKLVAGDVGRLGDIGMGQVACVASFANDDSRSWRSCQAS